MRISDWSSDVCSSDLEAGGHELVSHDVRSRPALRRGLLLEGTEAEDVVDVPVGVDDRAEPVGVPGAKALVVRRRADLVAGVEQQEAPVGVEGGGVAERRDRKSTRLNSRN